MSDAKLFVCPCHNGTWNLDCQRLEREDFNNPAPRPMDDLEVRLVSDPDPEHAVLDRATKQKKNDTLIEVKYENFYQGLEEKVAKK